MASNRRNLLPFLLGLVLVACTGAAVAEDIKNSYLTADVDGDVERDTNAVFLDVDEAELFAKIDADENGLVTMDEVVTAARTYATGIKEEFIEKYFPTADADGDGSISRDEASAVLSLLAVEGDDREDEDEDDDESDAVANLLYINRVELFAKVDTDRNEFLTLDELVAAAREHATGFDEEVIKEYFAKADIDGDGSISKDEAVTFLTLFDVAHGEDEDDSDADFIQGGAIELLAKIDSDNNGFITMDELSTAVVEHGSEINEEVVKEYFPKADIDGDGSISKDEAVTFLTLFDVAHAEDEDDSDADVPHVSAVELFAKIDSDNNGFITMDELLTALPALTINGSEINEEVVKKYFLKADLDGDGSVSKDEAATVLSLLEIEHNEAEDDQETEENGEDRGDVESLE